MAYIFRRSITIDHTQCGSAASTGWPLLISGTFPFLKDIANGGEINDFADTEVNFYADAGLTAPLWWEDVEWDPTTGILEFWVQIPNLSVTQDTVIYMAYHDPTRNHSWPNSSQLYLPDYRAVWHFPSTLNIIGQDSTINQNGFSNSGVTEIAGHIGPGAGSFNGSSFINEFHNTTGIPPVVSLDVTGPFTMQAIVKIPAASTNFQVLYGGYGLSGGTGIGLAIGNITAGHLGVFTDQVGSWTEGATALNDNAWHFIAVVFDGSVFRFYVDGTAEVTTPAGSPGSSNTTTDRYLGSPTGGLSHFFTGTMEEFRLSGVARSASWLLAEFNNQSVLYPSTTFFTLGAEVVVPVNALANYFNTNSSGMSVSTR